MRRSGYPRPRAGLHPLAGLVAAFIFASLASAMAAPAVAGDRAAPRLSLGAAIRKAFAYDPRIRVALGERATASAETSQAGKRSNPELWFEAENFLGSNDFVGFKSAQFTLGLNQKLETGGKRTARVTVAEGKEAIADAEIRIARLDVGARVIKDFVRVLGAGLLLDAERERERRITDLLPALRRRVQAGGSPETDVVRGELAGDRAKIAVEKAEAQLAAARETLAVNWGGRGGEAAGATGSLPMPGARSTPLASLEKSLDGHPQLARWNAERETRSAELGLQESLASPDVTVGLAGRQSNELDSRGLVAQATIPIQLFDSNEGNIAAARLRLSAIEARRAAEFTTLRRELVASYGVLNASCTEARRYAEGVTPKAERNVISVQEGYEAGRFRVLELLDAAALVTEAKGQQIAALVECHTASAAIRALTRTDPLTGRDLSSLEYMRGSLLPSGEKMENQ